MYFTKKRFGISLVVVRPNAQINRALFVRCLRLESGLGRLAFVGLWTITSYPNYSFSSSKILEARVPVSLPALDSVSSHAL